MAFFRKLFNSIFRKNSGTERIADEAAEESRIAAKPEEKPENKDAHRGVAYSRPSVSPSGPPTRHAAHTYEPRPGTTAGHSPASKSRMQGFISKPPEFKGEIPEEKE